MTFREFEEAIKKKDYKVIVPFIKTTPEKLVKWLRKTWSNIWLKNQQ